MGYLLLPSHHTRQVLEGAWTSLHEMRAQILEFAYFLSVLPDSDSFSGSGFFSLRI
jgi:hypothetical protein